MNGSDKFREWCKSRVVTLDSPERILRHVKDCKNIRDDNMLPYPDNAERAKIDTYIQELERKLK